MRAGKPACPSGICVGETSPVCASIRGFARGYLAVEHSLVILSNAEQLFHSDRSIRRHLVVHPDEPEELEKEGWRTAKGIAMEHRFPNDPVLELDPESGWSGA